MAPEATAGFPTAESMDEDACYEKPLPLLHPEGLACSRCLGPGGRKVHRRRRAPVLDYRRSACGRVFNAFTATVFPMTYPRPSEPLLILRDTAQGVPSASLARASLGSPIP